MNILFQKKQQQQNIQLNIYFLRISHAHKLTKTLLQIRLQVLFLVDWSFTF